MSDVSVELYPVMVVLVRYKSGPLQDGLTLDLCLTD